MNDAGRPQTDKQRHLDGVVAEYRRRVANGEVVDREKLIADFPHLADELRAFFALDSQAAALAEAPFSGLETLHPDPLADSIAERPGTASAPTPKRFGRYEVLKSSAGVRWV